MRLTAILCKQHIGLAFKKKWEYMSKKPVIDLGVPKPLLDKNVSIANALDIVKKPKTIYNLEKLLPYEPALCDLRNHPNFKENPIYNFNNDTKLVEGLPQIQVLLKTVITQGLPSCLQQRLDELELPQQDRLVQQKIANCFFQDATQTRLPKTINLANLGKTPARIYGIPVARKVNNFSHHLLHLCSMASPQNRNNSISNNTKLSNAKIRVYVQKAKKDILFNFRNVYTLLSPRPLTPFGDPQYTESQILPDIQPLSPFLNLAKLNVYDVDQEQSLLGESYSGRALFPNLIGITHEPHHYWLEHQKVSRAVSNCFANAVAIAHKLYGPKVRHLPSPVCVQGILNSRRHVTLIAYQLNTLNLEVNEGLKNQVWIDGPNRLYESFDELNGQVVDYDPSVFKKILALYANA